MVGITSLGGVPQVHVDRSRESWVESLSVFLRHLRQVQNTGIRGARYYQRKASQKPMKADASNADGTATEESENEDHEQEKLRSCAWSDVSGTDDGALEEESSDEKKGRSNVWYAPTGLQSPPPFL